MYLAQTATRGKLFYPSNYLNTKLQAGVVKRGPMVSVGQQKRLVASGKATAEGTGRYAERHHDLPYSTSTEGLKASRVGFGGYRIGGDDEYVHSYALNKGLTSGMNVIDTSSNYMDGLSEKLIGNVLEGLIENNEIKRDEVIVMSKAGIIQGKILEAVREKEKNGENYPDMVIGNIFLYPSTLFGRPNHCIIREIEGYLSISFNLTKKLGIWDQEFYRRIEQAFEHLEKEVRRGRIQCYGVSSEFSKKDDPSVMSLEILLHVAERVSPSHHFAAIQFPFNIFEMSAHNAKNNLNETKTVIQLAKEAGIFTIGNRPLNAIADKTLLFRLATPHDAIEPSAEALAQIKETLNYTIHLEKTYPGTDPNHPLVKEGQLPDYREMSWAQLLVSNAQTLDYYKFKEAIDLQIKPISQRHLATINRIGGMQEWCMNYKRGLERSLEVWGQLLAWNRASDISKFEQAFTSGLDELAQFKNLPQKALQVLMYTDIDSVLVGARSDSYVNDCLTILRENKEKKNIDEFKFNNLLEFANEQSKFIASKHKVNPNADPTNPQRQQ